MVHISLIHSEPSRFTRVTKIFLLIIGLLIAFLFYYFDYKQIESDIPLILSGLFLFVAIVSFVRSCLKKEFIVTGDMILYDDSILMSTPKVIGTPLNLNELESINVSYYGYLGESYSYSLSSYQNFMLKDGNRNHISLVRKTHTVDCEFFLANKAQCINLIRQLRIYQSKGLSVSMTDNSGRNMLIAQN